MFSRARVTAPFGELTIVASDAGLRYVMFDNDAHPKPVDTLAIADDESHPIVALASAQLAEYFKGTRSEFDIPLDLVGTEFQIAAWKSLASIPFGTTTSYAKQAASIGRPTATRAIGAANGRNPVVIVLPCHRIVGADGSLTGFGGGLPTKQWLLQHEQKVVARVAAEHA